jgi:hypothetical protein
LKVNVEDTSKVEVIIYVDWVEYAKFDNLRRIELAINEERNLEVWMHEIKIKATDTQGNQTENMVNLEVLKR